MSDQISKTYDPASIEAPIYKMWLDEKCFHPQPTDPGAPYCIVIPPPNVTGALHLGHAINNTLQDVLIRVHRMRGFNTLWMPGIDHAGIATQAVVEKQLKEKENKTRHDVGREGLVERIWKWKQEYGDRILEQLKRMGCSCDWDRTRFTLDDQCAKAVRETFFKLFKDGLIYRGKRLVNWDIHLQTSISDDEIYHESVKTNLWHIRYPIVSSDGTPTGFPSHGTTPLIPSPGTPGEGQGEGPISSLGTPGEDKGGGSSNTRATHMTVATTRPETMLGDTAVAVHSQDPRWNWAIGKFAQLPLTNRKIPIIADDILVDPKFGSGVVKVTPGHDPNDYAVWQRHLNQPDQIEILDILNPDGTINQVGGPYAGMKRDAVRKKIVADLTAAGLLEKEEPYETQVGHSDRSKTAIEPLRSDQWFVKMADLAEPALKVVRDHIIEFFPERHAQQYLSWLGEKRDWPISRQLWWGHRIPVWTITTNSSFRSGEDLIKHNYEANRKADDIKSTLKAYLTACGVNCETDLFILDSEAPVEYFVRFSVRTSLANEAMDAFIKMHASFELKPAPFGKVLSDVPGFEKANKDYFELSRFIAEIYQDPDVLDTWFSSGLWPHSTLGWPDQTPELKKWYPGNVLVTSREIITLWVARMVMLGMYNMGQKSSALFPSPGTPGEGQGEGPISSLDAPASSEAIRRGEDKGGGSAETLARQLGIPFHHVYIHTTILDGHGERMSKSKGNGVDPVEVIETNGADSLRFTLTNMATETQDVRLPVKKDAQRRNTSEKFEIGSRFCNKIWQVAHHFVLSNLEKIPAEPVDESKWSLADRWIVSRFNRTVTEADEALANYRFDQYAKICYDFFYGDFCDWYVEASKPALRDPTRAPQTANILAAVLDGSLRLMHPMIPFITESIWQRLCNIRPDRGLPNRIPGCTANRLILAAWPKPTPLDDRAADFDKLKDVISAIRKFRNEYKIEIKQILQAAFQCPTNEAQSLIEQNRATIESLATCKITNIAGSLAATPGVRILAADYEIWIVAPQDDTAESTRIAKRKEELTKQIQTLKGRLASESYISKAPPHLVQQTRDQLAQAEAELAKLG